MSSKLAGAAGKPVAGGTGKGRLVAIGGERGGENATQGAGQWKALRRRTSAGDTLCVRGYDGRCFLIGGKRRTHNWIVERLRHWAGRGLGKPALQMG